MTPVLYIGIGSSGLRMLEETQRLFYSTTESCCPEHVRFLFVETDADVKPNPIPGQPRDRAGIEEFRTVLDGVGKSIDRLQRMVKVKVIPSDDPPKDAATVLIVKDRYAERPTLIEPEFPASLYQSMAHVFSGTDQKLADETAFRHLSAWLSEGGIKDGKISVRLRGDRLEVFSPSDLSEKLQLRIELLFNDIELTTRLEKDSKQKEIETIRWLPTKETVAFADAGAGGMRSVGRIALWGNSTKGEGRYLHNFRSKIRSLIQELRPHAQGRDPIVYIAGTFAGGTNSGMFIDVAYLCRDAMDPTHTKNPPVLGLFLLPEVDSGDVKTVSNAYACLRDLDHFTSRESQFLARWPLDVAVDPFERGTTPFKMATLMSLSWVPDQNLSTLCRMAGLFLFLMGTGFINYRKARAIDVRFDNSQSIAAESDADLENYWKFSAVGLTALFYPRGEIRVCAACESASQRILSSWLDPQHCDGFEQDGTTISSVYSERWPAYRQQIDDTLTSCFARLANNGPGGRPAVTEFQKFVNKAAKGQTDFNPEALRDYLSESSSIYEAARSVASPESPRRLPEEEKNWTAIEMLQSAINSMVSREIDDTGSLVYGIKIIEGISDYLTGILELWESLEIGEWDAALEGAGDSSNEGILSTILSAHGTAFGVRNEVRRARFEEALRLMFIHLMAPHLKKLRQELINEQPPQNGNGRFPGMINLAEINQLSRLIREASTVVDSHKELVLAGIRPNALIKYVYPRGSFKAEVDTTLTQVLNATAGPRKKSLCKDLVSHLSQTSALESLRSCSGRPELLAGYAIECVTTKLQEAALPHPAPPADNAHYLLDNPDLATFAMRAVSDISVQMGRKSDTLDNASTHPKVVVTDTQQNAQKVANDLAANGVLGFDSNQSMNAATPLLKDMVLFFDERPVTRVQDLAGLALWKPQYDKRRISENSLDTYFHT